MSLEIIKGKNGLLHISSSNIAETMETIEKCENCRALGALCGGMRRDNIAETPISNENEDGRQLLIEKASCPIS